MAPLRKYYLCLEKWGFSRKELQDLADSFQQKAGQHPQEWYEGGEPGREMEQEAGSERSLLIGRHSPGADLWILPPGRSTWSSDGSLKLEEKITVRVQSGDRNHSTNLNKI